MTTIRKTYSEEFKIKAVELSRQRGNSSAVAQELGIRVSMLYKWQKALQAVKLVHTKAKPKIQDEQEIIRLRKALHETQIERDILKKAVGIFTKSDQ